MARRGRYRNYSPVVRGTDLASHEAAADPHTGYLKESDLGGVVRYAIPITSVASGLLVNGETLYFGGLAIAPTTTQGVSRLYIPKGGTIKAAYVWSYAATTAGSDESWALALLVNGTGSPTSIQSVGVAAAGRGWANTGLSLAVAQGDYLEVVATNPTWATPPEGVTFGGVLYVEADP